MLLQKKSDMELNPNNKTTQQVRGEWHKIAALIMFKTGFSELNFTMQDIYDFTSGQRNIVIDSRKESELGVLTIRIVDDKTADQLAREAGGRACDN